MDEASQRLAETLKDFLETAFTSDAQLYTLTYITQFLKRVSEYSETNKMTAANLAMVFAPNLMRQVREEGEADTIQAQMIAMAQMGFGIDVVQALIVHGDTALPPLPPPQAAPQVALQAAALFSDVKETNEAKEGSEAPMPNQVRDPAGEMDRLDQHTLRSTVESGCGLDDVGVGVTLPMAAAAQAAIDSEAE